MITVYQHFHRTKTCKYSTA